jgi:ribose 5-phosphate isomerase A
MRFTPTANQGPAMPDPSLSTDQRKSAAAHAAVAEIEEGMLVGLGTGSTAAFAIEELGARVARGLRVRAVATSRRTADHAARLGIAVIDAGGVARIDLAIDGVDEIDPALRAIKGAGGAMLREKVVASMAGRMIAIADDSKAAARLGGRALPVEVLPLAQGFVAGTLAALGAGPVLRRGADGGPVATDQGNLILDCALAPDDPLWADPARLAAHLQAIPGLLGHGLFLSEIDALYLGTADGVICTQRPVPG